MAIRNNRFKRSMLMYVVKNVVYCIKELERCPARVASFFFPLTEQILNFYCFVLYHVGIFSLYIF